MQIATWFAPVLRRMALRMRSAEDTAVRWRVTSSIALVILLRLAGCEPFDGLESWFCMDLQALDQMQFVFALPSEDVAAQATRAVFRREGSLFWMSLLAAWRTLLERWQVLRPQEFLKLLVLGAWWIFTRRALADFRCSSPESLWEGFTASAKDWRCMQQTATDAVSLFTAPLSWDALATDEAFVVENVLSFCTPGNPGRSFPCAPVLRRQKAVTPLGSETMSLLQCLLFLHRRCGVVRFRKLTYYSRPLPVRSSPTETTSRDCLGCLPRDYRETPWSAQPQRLPSQTAWSAQAQRLP